MALEHTSDNLLEMREDAARYRLVLVEAIHALADRERRLQFKERAIDALREEVRALRADRDRRLAFARSEYARLRDENKQLRAALMQPADGMSRAA